MSRTTRFGWVVAMAIAGVTAAPSAHAAPLPKHIKITGASCAKALQVAAGKGLEGGSRPGPRSPFDDHWIDLTITPGATSSDKTRYDVTWALKPGVKLCPGSWTRLGLGTDTPITTAAGTRGDDVTTGGPAQAKIKARFAQDIELRDGVGPAKLRTLVAGWARGGCGSDDAGARLLASLATRAGAHDCTPPRRLRPTQVDLLHHAVAHFNHAKPAGAAQDEALGTAYYGVLAQLTTFDLAQAGLR